MRAHPSRERSWKLVEPEPQARNKGELMEACTTVLTETICSETFGCHFGFLVSAVKYFWPTDIGNRYDMITNTIEQKNLETC